MRKHIVKTILKKEIVDILRDKKTLFMTIILPILLYPALILLMSVVMNKSSTDMAQRTLTVAFNQMPNERVMESIIEYNEEQNQGALEVIQINGDRYKTLLSDGTLDAYVEINEEEASTEFIVYYNSSKDNSTEICNRLDDILCEYKEQMVSSRILEAGLEEEYILEPVTYEFENTADQEQVAGYMLGLILPFLLIIGILTGAIYPAIDVMAGEKERGTLETLLTMPISNVELVMGKYLAVACSALVSALLSILSVGFSILFLFLSASEAVEGIQVQIDFTRLILPLIITLICIFLFTLVMSAVSMCVCSLAKSFKEAQNAMTPLMCIAMILSYSSMIPTIELNTTTASIPVVNIVLLIKSVLTFKYNLSLLTIVLISNMIFMLVAIWVLSKIFNSEDILFGSGKSFTFLEKRSDIKVGTMPNVSDAIILYAIFMIVMIYICSYLQAKFGMGGIALTQVIIIGLPLIVSFYIKTDFKKVYSFNMPKVKHLFASILLWMGAWILMILLENVLISFAGQETQEALGLQQQMLMGHHPIIVFGVVAILPAICEELFFRGFIFKGIEDGTHPIRAIIISSILFALAHFDMVKFAPLMLLALAMGYVIYKTKSIFCTMLIHFLNNGFAIVLSKFATSQVVAIETKIQEGGNMAIVLIVGIAIFLCGLGIVLLRTGKTKEQVIEG